MVAVFVGTDHHRFSRVLDWAAQLQAEGRFRFHVQHGNTPLPPGLTGQASMNPSAMADVLRKARAVVTHGGPGSIMDARTHGHVPIVVPRDPRLGEHVDDHQQRFARFLAPTGHIIVADTLAELAARLTLATVMGPAPHAEDQSLPTVARFQDLVDGLLRR